jgi:hypothetical protein
MMIPTVDYRDIDVGVLKRLDGGETAESRSDDDYVWATPSFDGGRHGLAHRDELIDFHAVDML